MFLLYDGIHHNKTHHLGENCFYFLKAHPTSKSQRIMHIRFVLGDPYHICWFKPLSLGGEHPNILYIYLQYRHSMIRIIIGFPKTKGWMTIPPAYFRTWRRTKQVLCMWMAKKMFCRLSNGKGGKCWGRCPKNCTTMYCPYISGLATSVEVRLKSPQRMFFFVICPGILLLYAAHGEYII